MCHFYLFNNETMADFYNFSQATSRRNLT